MSIITSVVRFFKRQCGASRASRKRQPSPQPRYALVNLPNGVSYALAY